MLMTRDFSHYVKDVDADTAHLDLAVEGVSCAGCMAKIERGLSSIPDVTRARVNFTDRRLAIEWKKGAINPALFIDRLAELGYKAYPFEPMRAEIEEASRAKWLLTCLGVAAFASMNVMMLSIPIWVGTDMLPETRDFFHWLSALVVLPSAAYAGQPFFKSAWQALRARSVNMDVPISIGVILALAMSLVETINHAEHAYFDAAIMLLTFLLAGRFLDQKMRQRTRAVAGNLAALKAETATKFVGPDEIREVPIAAVQPGDIVLLRAGERCAVDGVVIEGRSEIDQSLITGETRHVPAERGVAVYAGTLNMSGSLRIKVSAAAEGTLLAEISRLLENALQARSRYVQLADRASRLYAPLVHITALLTMLGWVALGASWHDAIVTAIAVLIITCPCALGLAIPAVQTVASGAMFRAGVLLNTGDAIERVAEVDTVVFDKTGTLTMGTPVLEEIDAIDEETLSVAAALAVASSHPLAKAILAAAEAREIRPVTLDDLREVPGFGIEGRLGRLSLRLGRADWVGAEPCAATATHLRLGEAPPVTFRFSDHLRTGAAEAVALLTAQGKRVLMVSGDVETAVSALAGKLGITEWYSGALPAEKAALIADLMGQGRRVLMVGDGLNDTAALAAAHVSISPASALDAARTASDIVLLGADLAPVGDALRIAGQARRRIKENFAISAGYNVVAVPLALVGLATPLAAALAMSTSSITVSLNSMRLK